MEQNKLLCFITILETLDYLIHLYLVEQTNKPITEK